MKTLAFVVLLLASASSSAELRFEALGGQCHYSKVGNYVWHNEHYPHELDMRSGCALIGISSVGRNDGNLALGWRIAYVDHGKATTNAVFPMRDDEQISVLPDGSNCNPITWNGCIGRGKGQQTARGLSFGVLAERKALGAAWEIEGGLFAYLGSWRVHIEPEAPSNFHPVTYDWEGYQITPFVGFGVRDGYLMGIVRFYGRVRAAEHGCGVCSGVANSVGTQVGIGLSVPF